MKARSESSQKRGERNWVEGGRKVEEKRKRARRG